MPKEITLGLSRAIHAHAMAQIGMTEDEYDKADGHAADRACCRCHACNKYFRLIELKRIIQKWEMR